MGEPPFPTVPVPGQAEMSSRGAAPAPPVPGPPPLNLQEQAASTEHAVSYTSVPPPPPPQHAFASQLEMAPSPPSSRPGAYNMAPMANALPQSPPYRAGQYPSGSHQRYGTASPPMMPHMPQYVPMPNQAPIPNQAPPYVQPPHQPMQYYGSGGGGGGQMSQGQSQSHMPPRQNVNFYTNPMMMNHPQNAYYYPQAAQYTPQNQPLPGGMIPGQYMPGSPSAMDPRVMSHSPPTAARPFQSVKSVQEAADSKQGAVRGPPRKPRQSGHAIWIGNLPPQADLMNLVKHVCDRAPGLESLFLISKSNCAFANFKDESTCVEAQQKLHESNFQGGRLVSRLRKSTVEGASGSTAPTGPAGNTTSPTSPVADQTPASPLTDMGSPNPANEHQGTGKAASNIEGTPQQDRFFILKSLTVEDLELSIRTGIWATQSHNEEILNKAFKSADNVYLVFSANKSGEYFGYARMLSEINEDPAAAIEFAPKAQAVSDNDLPKAIPTEALNNIPKGRIIDDSARGTIFWELDRDDEEGDSDDESEVSSHRSNGVEDESKAWGKPFKLKWLSTFRLPFYRTRGLRNPWNSNREVKIARDGTELEPSVGRRLIGLFNRLQAGQFSPQMRHPATMHSQMRPYGP